MVDQKLFNWVKAGRAGKLTGAYSRPVSAEQMEIARLRPELARVKMERDIVGKATEYGVTSSMSRKGDRWDAPCSETLFGSLKVERLHGQRLKTRRHAKDEVVAWLLWYNSTRLHSTLGYVSPMQFEKSRLAA